MNLMKKAIEITKQDFREDAAKLERIEKEREAAHIAFEQKKKQLDAEYDEIRCRMIVAINSKAQVRVDECMKVSGLGNVLVCVTLTGIVITNLKSDKGGPCIGIRGCEDVHGQHNYLNEYVSPNEKIVILPKQLMGVKPGDILVPG